MADNRNPSLTTIMAALSTLNPSHQSHVTSAISTLVDGYRRRISAILESSSLFTLTHDHLHSLSLREKSLLIARHLVSNLKLLTHLLRNENSTLPPASMNGRDLDAVLLLLLLCEYRQHKPLSLDGHSSVWRDTLREYVSDTIMKIAGMEVSDREVLIKYVETVAMCKNFVDVTREILDSGGPKMEDAPAAVSAVVALPSVEVEEGGDGEFCAICREDMRGGRDVCQMPCKHLFHWMCILPWLKKTNTCPYCRFRLPTDEIYVEIGRLWEVVVEMAGAGGGGGPGGD